MSIDLTALRAKLAAAPAAAATTAAQPPAQQQLTAPAALAAVAALVQNIPADNPKLSVEENYLRQSSAQAVQDKIQQLQQRLLENHPTMPVLLQEIHKTLKQQPDNVTLLSDEQVGVIVRGLLQHTGTTLASAKAAKAKKAAPKNLSLADLGFD